MYLKTLSDKAMLKFPMMKAAMITFTRFSWAFGSNDQSQHCDITKIRTIKRYEQSHQQNNLITNIALSPTSLWLKISIDENQN